MCLYIFFCSSPLREWQSHTRRPRVCWGRTCCSRALAPGLSKVQWVITLTCKLKKSKTSYNYFCSYKKAICLLFVYFTKYLLTVLKKKTKLAFCLAVKIEKIIKKCKFYLGFFVFLEREFFLFYNNKLLKATNRPLAVSESARNNICKHVWYAVCTITEECIFSKVCAHLLFFLL